MGLKSAGYAARIARAVIIAVYSSPISPLCERATLCTQRTSAMLGSTDKSHLARYVLHLRRPYASPP
eukprot:IDg17987t1